MAASSDEKFLVAAPSPGNFFYLFVVEAVVAADALFSSTPAYTVSLFPFFLGGEG